MEGRSPSRPVSKLFSASCDLIGRLRRALYQGMASAMPKSRRRLWALAPEVFRVAARSERRPYPPFPSCQIDMLELLVRTARCPLLSRTSVWALPGCRRCKPRVVYAGRGRKVTLVSKAALGEITKFAVIWVELHREFVKPAPFLVC